MKKNELPITQSEFVNLLLDAVCVVDEQGRFVFISAAGERIFGYKPEEMIGMEPLALVHPEDRERTRQVIADILDGQIQPYFENRYTRKDGSIAHIMWSARFSEVDRLRVAVARDVTEVRHAEAMQKAMYEISDAVNTSADLTAMLATIHRVVVGLVPCEGFLIALWDKARQTVEIPYVADPDANAPQQQVLVRYLAGGGRMGACAETQIAGDEASTAAPEQSLGLEQPWLTFRLELDDHLIGLLAVYSQASEVRFDENEKALLKYVASQMAGAIERKQNQAQLEFMARHDALTGLPNRALFTDRLDAALAMARRDNGNLAVLFIDLNRFKEINDTYGHETGDQLLQAVAQRLEQAVRQSDTVGRLGGDEFVVLLPSIGNDTSGSVVAEKLLGQLIAPYQLGELRISIIPSIGLAMYPEHGADAAALLRHADDAMYREKRYG